MSVLRLAFQPDFLPTEISRPLVVVVVVVVVVVANLDDVPEAKVNVTVQ